MTIEPLPANPEWTASWSAAVHLYRHLVTGGVPGEVSTSLLLAPGEATYSDLTLGYARFYGMDVTYQQSGAYFRGGLLFVAAGLAANAVSNNIAKQRAENQAAPQWREHCAARVVVTNYCVMCFVHGRWLRFAYSNVVDFNADMLNGVCYLIFDGAEPLQLAGLQVPWLVVLLSSFLYGPKRLSALPFLETIARA
ncbi:hypothetical protein SAMN04488564_112255 [Lentzea waywayandensis]|uniref:Uncharacterized protein n=2 Tax=Lentzea waywayandensis TaxID=84724 RepID=A0A1I6FE20_9PSEU|nr:hypothetical protein SAMN04488564_112255 [Lentzea waywayandensis]